MKRYFFKISYDGTSFFGWQNQPKQITVQETIESNLSKIHSHRKISIAGCGRTDTGVHAKEYFFHWDDNDGIDLKEIKYKLNKMLPKSIAVHSIQEVPMDMHARFSAKERTYQYHINTVKHPFLAEQSWFVNQKLDVSKMNAAAALLIGKKDFGAFAKIHADVNNHICDLNYIKWTENDQKIIFEIRANRFLRNMVRAIVGTLVDVGLNKINIEEFQEIIDSKNRQKASTSAPAKGLYLWKVRYHLESL